MSFCAGRLPGTGLRERREMPVWFDRCFDSLPENIIPLRSDSPVSLAKASQRAGTMVTVRNDPLPNLLSHLGQCHVARVWQIWDQRQSRAADPLRRAMVGAPKIATLLLSRSRYYANHAVAENVVQATVPSATQD